MPPEPDPTISTLARGLPRTALDALHDALARLPAERAARGRLLATSPSLSAVSADSRGVRANVGDGHQFVTRWAWSGDGASSLCSCATGRECEHAFALGILLLAAARRAGRWDHARWGSLEPPALAAEPAPVERDTPRRALAVEALAEWAGRGQGVARRLRRVLGLEQADA